MSDANLSLHGVISRLCAGPRSRRDIELLVTACHRMAIAYIRVKSARREPFCSRFGLTPEDLAFDAIADLFSRDEDGTFPVLETFVARLTPCDTPELHVENSLRRFVCAFVDRRLFDLYRQFDPSLGKIIRNLKLAAAHHPDVTLSEYLGEKVLACRETRDLALDRPVISVEMLLAELPDRIEGTRTLRKMLSAISGVLLAEETYRPYVSVSVAAMAVRSLLSAGPTEESTATVENDITEEDIRQIVDRSLHSLRGEQGSKYIKKRALTHQELDAHLCAVRDILLREFSEDGENHITYFDYLHRHLRGISEVDFNVKHRTVLDYLVKVAKGLVIDELGG